jgi:hypothetical protein
MVDHAARAGYVFFGSMVEVSRRMKAAAMQLGPPSLDAIINALQPPSSDPEAQAARAAAATAAVTEACSFLLLDMRAVSGIDATAASEFGAVRRMLESRGVTLVLAGISRHASVKHMLVSNGVITVNGVWEGGAGSPAFESMDAALVWCQEHFQQVAVLHHLIEDFAGQELTLEAAMRMHLVHTLLTGEDPSRSSPFPAATHDPAGATLPRLDSAATTLASPCIAVARQGASIADGTGPTGGIDEAAPASEGHSDGTWLSTIVGVIGRHMQARTLAAGEVLFEQGDAADAFFIVLRGTLVSVVDLQRFGQCATSQLCFLLWCCIIACSIDTV